MDDSRKEMAEVKIGRDKVIIRTSIIGILTNVFLAAFKAAVGLLSHSIAVTLDAVNNLSDALSSIITIIGTKLAGKLPDKKHPYGHGRIEYLSAMIVSGIVLYAGITSGVESIKKIIHPEKPDYSTLSLVIIAVAVAAKILLGRYVKAQGEKVNSGSLIASGSDALNDAILSSSVLACALLFKLTAGKVALEAYVGIVIAVFIVKAGVEMMTETLEEILGRRADREMTLNVKRILNEEPAVQGAYDLFLYNYGPDKNYASVHLELPDTMTVKEVDQLTRRAEVRVYKETGVLLTGVGVYSYNTGNDEAAKIRNDIQRTVLLHDWAVQMHGFYVDTEAKVITFDVVLNFDVNPKEAMEILYEEVGRKYPGYDLQIVPDVDVSVTE